jgi:uncharacterized protein (DUF58 family)
MTIERSTGLPAERTHLRPWRATPAHQRAIVLAALGTLVAAVLRRADLLVMATPFLVVATWGRLARPRHTPSVAARIGNRGLGEGETTRWTATCDLPAGTDEVHIRLAPTSFVVGDPSTDLRALRHRRGAETAERALPARVTRWGERRIGPGLVAARSPWWAYRCPVTEVGAFDVLVTPSRASFESATTTPHPEGLVGVNRSMHVGTGSEFATIRRFQPGDRLRRIHWPSSLREGELQVTTTYSDEDAHVVLIVDAFSDLGPREGIDGRPTSLDLTVRACAAMADHYLRSGDRVSLRVLGAQATPRLPAGSGAAQSRRILDTLARVEPATDRELTTVRALDGLTSGSLVIVLTPLVHPALAGVIASTAARGLTTLVVDTLPEHLGSDRQDRYAALAWRVRRLERQDELDRQRAAGVPVVPWRGPGSLDVVLRDVARRARRPRLARR